MYIEVLEIFLSLLVFLSKVIHTENNNHEIYNSYLIQFLIYSIQIFVKIIYVIKLLIFLYFVVVEFIL